MQKEDIQWAVLGILLLLVVALVIRPIATGEPPNIGLPTATPTATPALPVTAPPLSIPATTITTPPTPTPVTTWNTKVQTVGFVDPSTYGLNLNESLPNSTKFPAGDTALRSGNYTTFATFSSQYSGTTQVVKIPFPYWELWYTVDPITSDLQKQAEPSGKYVITPTQGKGASMSGYAGSYSTAMPVLTIQVIDAEDPNRIVRAISPPGGIDPAIWTKDAKTVTGETIKAYDPRPWKEKFYEGQRSYYFVIKASLLKSYKIDIMIPDTYVGKY